MSHEIDETRAASAIDAIEALRRAVASAAVADDEGLRSATSADALADVEIVAVPGESTLDHVRLRLAVPVRLDALEARFGAARPLPTRPSGGSSRSVLFDQTMPAEGSTDATLLADVDAAGTVESITLRRDEL